MYAKRSVKGQWRDCPDCGERLDAGEICSCKKGPDLQDRVKHKQQHDYVGVVIARYKELGTVVLDIRLEDDRIYYKSPAENWEIVQRNEDQDG